MTGFLRALLITAGLFIGAGRAGEAAVAAWPPSVALRGPEAAALPAPAAPLPANADEAAAAQRGEPGAGLVTIPWAASNQKSDPKWGPLMTDVQRHKSPKDPTNYSGPDYFDNGVMDCATVAHEMTHGINSHVRNTGGLSGNRNGFYLGEGRAITLMEPKMTMKEIIPFIPESLRGSRYKTYLISQQQYFLNQPLYMFDEWSAYVLGSKVGVEQYQLGFWPLKGRRDAVAGEMEFFVYAVAAVMAVRKHDSAYYEATPQLRELAAFLTAEMMKNYTPGSQIPAFQFDSDKKYYEAVKTAPDAAAFRGFVRELVGADWALRNIGF